MFIKSICLSNFKGFIGENHQINFKIPDGTTPGSGLNIFVGENNSGKSSIFEAVDFLRNGIKGEIDRIRSKRENNTQPEHACIELTFCGDIENSVNYFVQSNKQTHRLTLQPLNIGISKIVLTVFLIIPIQSYVKKLQSLNKKFSIFLQNNLDKHIFILDSMN